ncbi:uncharacterized protein LOC119073358 [Bradysia coprophila]|uniref:uncharacterized protein LOC119073358 n=1 Tax=Bradysia coprophila TaxID=38358 RepID=UPI00187D9656|nr:uncharacterized protein LOC119073358 [Bradysia coprophila]
MRISFLVLPSLILAVSAATTSSPKTENATKTAKKETRDKRTVDQFGRSLNSHFSNNFNFNYGSPSISKRISNAPKYDNSFYSTNSFASPQFAQSDFNYNGLVKDFDSHGSNFIHEPPHYAPQYLEAPEPIIEIIIKESNESLPITPQPYVQQKKPKEQVQVFYVKYKKDDQKGGQLVIDDPIPALSPEAYHQEHESNDEVDDVSYPVTQPPPLKTTTLRTIIHPDSEKFHSNSGIYVTFNSESKHNQADHSYQEHFEESSIQQVVANSDQQQYHQQYFNPNTHIQQKQLKTANPNPNNYNENAGPNNYNNENHTPYHLSYQQLPHQHGPTQAFRENHDHFYRRPPPPHQPPSQPAYQPQPQQSHPPHPPHPQFQQEFSKPSHSFDKQQFTEGQTYRFQSHPNQHQTQFKKPSRPKPIPIPLHNEEQQSYTQLTRPSQQQTHQQYAQQEQFSQNRPPVNAPSHNSPPPQFQQPFNHFQEYNRNTNRFYQQNVQSGSSAQQQNPPNFNVNTEDHRPFLPSSNFNVESQRPSIPTQIFNSDVRQNYRQPEIVTGAELVQSLPKYEQHITETIPATPNNQIYRPLVQSHPQQTPSEYRHTTASEQQFVQTNNSNQMQIVLPVNYQPNPYSVDPYKLPEYITQPRDNQQSQQRLPESKPQYSPLAVPIKQNLKPGQSVSTLADEVFSSLTSAHQSNFQQNGNNQQITGRNKVSVQKTVSVTQRPSETTYEAKTTTTTTERPPSRPSTTSKSSKKAQLELPDEVPDDLRQSLISSGILDNADISILDYDKIGDVPIESLPPEHLANFYGAGGASQISSSNKVVTVVKPNGEQVHEKEYKAKPDTEQKISARLPNVDLKVVRFDSNNQRAVTDKYIKLNSTVLPSVDIADQQYNRYLPLKVNGAQFPIPNVEELIGKTISSVVVLAPVDTNLQNIDEGLEGRFERDVLDSKQIKFVAGDSLKQLIKKPTKENFKKWLDKESKTDVDLQSVVLLVTQDNNDNAKEIYMYDIGLQRVNKLSGELSSAFVDVAEENASAQDMDNVSLSDSGIIEQMSTKISRSDENSGAENFDDESDHESQQASEIVSTYIKPTAEEKENVNQIVINSGYSVITH